MRDPAKNRDYQSAGGVQPRPDDLAVPGFFVPRPHKAVTFSVSCVGRERKLDRTARDAARCPLVVRT